MGYEPLDATVDASVLNDFLVIARRLPVNGFPRWRSIQSLKARSIELLLRLR